MDPEGARLPTASPPVHKYSSLRSAAHRAAASHRDGRCATRTVPAVY